MGLPPLEDEESGSGDDMETEGEPPELIRARETLAHYPARWAPATWTDDPFSSICSFVTWQGQRASDERNA